VHDDAGPRPTINKATENAQVCRAFGISRRTGYKVFERGKDYGLEALNGRSRRLGRCNPRNSLQMQIGLQVRVSTPVPR
jgi:leucine-zipper of insertion element IS481